MTSVLIIGGGGMIGQKLASSFSKNDSLTLLDIGFPNKNQSNARKIIGSVGDPEIIENSLKDLPEVIYYVASVVSGEAEADFSKGWDVNIHAFWVFLSPVKKLNEKSQGQYKPKIIFTSSRGL